MKNWKRFLAAAVCAVLVLGLIASCAYMVSSSGHHCAQEHCKICEKVFQLAILFGSVGLCALALLSLFFSMGDEDSFPAADKKKQPGKYTLVGWKVRLNN